MLKEYNPAARRRIGWLCVSYGLFLLGFFTLGFLSNQKAAAWINW